MENKGAMPPRVGFLVIGDEILSGKTKDVNVFALASGLLGVGYELAEVRMVPDVEAEIIDALNALRGKYKVVFTSGGIGPTHDDITAEAVAKAVGAELEENAEAAAELRRSCEAKGVPFNEARRKMAMIPKGGALIKTPTSAAPGFSVQNVYVLAGVPHIFASMLESVLRHFNDGIPVFTETLEDIGLPEGAIADELGEVQKRFQGRVAIGSYPSFNHENGSWKVKIALKGTNLNDVLDCKTALSQMLLKIS